MDQQSTPATPPEPTESLGIYELLRADDPEGTGDTAESPTLRVLSSIRPSAWSN